MTLPLDILCTHQGIHETETFIKANIHLSSAVYLQEAEKNAAALLIAWLLCMLKHVLPKLLWPVGECGRKNK